MNSHDIAVMAKTGKLGKVVAPVKLECWANIFTIAEDVRGRLNATDDRKPDNSHVHGLASLIDERRLLLQIERIIADAGY